MMRKLGGLFLFLVAALLSQGQAPSVQTLSVEEAVNMAMQKNYDVMLFRNSAALAYNENRFGFGVFIPSINAVGNVNRSVNNSRNLTFADVENVNPSAKSFGTNANIQGVWTLFDGTRMFATRKRISELAALGEINVRNSMMNTAASIITVYYSIVRQKQQRKAIVEQMSVSEERVKLAERKLQVGTGGKPELLQAKVDLNAFRTALLQQETLIQQLKDQLNGTLALSLPDAFETSDTIPINLDLTYEQIAQDIENTNQQLAAARKNIDVFEQVLKESRAGRSPIINLTGGLNLVNRTENEVQVTPATQKYTQSSGFNYGLQIQVPLVNGMNVNRLIGQAKVNLDRQKLIYEQQKTLVLVGVRVAFLNYDNAKRTLLIEEENILLAKENVAIALESFKRGIATAIELRTAQQSLVEAYNRLIAARFNAKISETELLRLKGSLLN